MRQILDKTPATKEPRKMGNSKSKQTEMKNLIGKLMTELAFQFDLFYDDQNIGILANEDSSFRVFRRGLEWMDENEMKMSKVVKHVRSRIERCHAYYFTTPLEDPDVAL